MKTCSKKDCFFNGQPQPLENFYKSKRDKGGFQSKCKSCEKKYNLERKEQIKEYNKNYNLTHRESRAEYRSENRDQISERKKEYREKNKEQIKEYQRQYDLTHRESRAEYRQDHEKEIQQYNKEYCKINKKQINARKRQYTKRKKQQDPYFKIKCNLRTRLYHAIKNNFKSGSAVADLMMSIFDFKIYLEKRFYPNPESGEMMTWENYGTLWHIDHIIPLSSFDLTNREELLKAVHFSNLRPMWAKQNISEGARGMSRRQTI